jgi:hypothetical protein
MTLADLVLRLLLSPRDRETVSGDLLEEYREHVLPSRGRVLAALWYWRQVIGFARPLTVGLALGVLAGVYNVIDTAIEPLADDSSGAMLRLFAVVLAAFCLPAGLAGVRTRRFRDTVLAGLVVGATTFFVLCIANTIRINVFLDTIQYRDDWRNLMLRFTHSGDPSLRHFVNREFLGGDVAMTAFGAVAGSICGIAAGLVQTTTRLVSERRWSR